MTNPYTHLRTLIDEGKHNELNGRLHHLHIDSPIIKFTQKNDECSFRHKNGFQIWAHLGGPWPQYTTSIDALMPLWPNKWHFTLKRFKGGDYTCDAQMSYRYSKKGLWRETPALAMLDCLLQVLEYEWSAANE